MLEREMEEAVAQHPDVFIESRLTLVRRQIVINKRRPDILFTDRLDRSLIVELQRGRLDEDHLQRHIYYYFDYLNLFPGAHPRLMFIANLIVPQHKLFLDAHGYEYREIPEGEFLRRIQGLQVAEKAVSAGSDDTQFMESISSEREDLLQQIRQETMTFSYKMILIDLLAEMADENGRVPLHSLAVRFSEFFKSRRIAGKAQENPNRAGTAKLADRSLHAWETTIRKMPVAHMSGRFVIAEGSFIRWVPEIWAKWTTSLAEEIQITATVRLVEYFNRYAGGY